MGLSSSEDRMIVAGVVLTQCYRLPACDRRTDRRTDGRIYYSEHNAPMLTRCKNNAHSHLSLSVACTVEPWLRVLLICYYRINELLKISFNMHAELRTSKCRSAYERISMCLCSRLRPATFTNSCVIINIIKSFQKQAYIIKFHILQSGTKRQDFRFLVRLHSVTCQQSLGYCLYCISPQGAIRDSQRFSWQQQTVAPSRS